MRQVNIHEAKTQLSRLIEQLESGEDIVIARYGRPVARLSQYLGSTAPRRPGNMRGRIEIRDDFDDPLPEVVLNGFEGTTG